MKYHAVVIYLSLNFNTKTNVKNDDNNADENSIASKVETASQLETVEVRIECDST